MIEKISKYVLAHERLLIVVGVLGLVLFLGNRYINYEARVAELQKDKAQAALQQQAIVVANLTSQLQAAQKNSDAVVAHTNAQVLALQGQIASLQANLVAQQTAIKTKPLPEVVTLWDQAIQIPDGVSNTSAGLVVTEAAARATLSQLIAVPVLTKTIENQTVELTSKDAAIAAQKTTIDASTSLVSGLNTKLVDQKKAGDAEVALAKANARKGHRFWFCMGYGLGLGTRGAVKIFTGF